MSLKANKAIKTREKSPFPQASERCCEGSSRSPSFARRPKDKKKREAGKSAKTDKVLVSRIVVTKKWSKSDEEEVVPRQSSRRAQQMFDQATYRQTL